MNIFSYVYAVMSESHVLPYSEAMEKDPACGGCLWAQGIIQCP
jgi:hypothetical protein